MISKPLSELIRVQHGDGEFSSKLVSLVALDPGAVLTKIEGAIPASQRAYSSVQVGENQDIELNSDLVYCNHSCDPSVIFDMAKFEIRVVADKPLKKDDDVTFFYPSSEWKMAQEFECQCASERCIRIVKGAQSLDYAILRRYWLNPHIERLLEKRDGSLGKR